MKPINEAKLSPVQEEFYKRLGWIQDHPYVALLVAIATNETLDGTRTFAEACSVLSSNGGRGIMQLTSAWPIAWDSPTESADFALLRFIEPAAKLWEHLIDNEDAFIRLVAATYNEGPDAAVKYHNQGNVDAGTTNHYGLRAFQHYQEITT